MIDQIRENWNKIVSKEQNELDVHAPVEVNEQPTCINEDCFKRMFQFVVEEIYETKIANEENDLVELLDGLVDVRYVLDGLIAQCGISQELFDKAYKEVYRSNMTKIKEGKVIMNEEGKVLKPDTYERPELEKLLRENNVKIPSKKK